MISTAQAIYGFLSGFEIPAYNEQLVPDDAVLPYLTYPLTEPEWDTPATFHINVYYRDRASNLAAMQKADEIVHAIGTGIRIPCEGGYVALYPQNPLIQALPTEDDVRAAYINLQINAYHMPGI